MAYRSGRIALGTAWVALTVGALPNGPAAAFTAEQAALGKTVYGAQCAACHGRKLEGGEAPGHSGVDVMGNWDTAGGLYDFISVAMPPSEPGKLGEEAYLGIIAFIMEVNGAAADAKALEAGDGMYELSIAHLGTNITAAEAVAAAAPASAAAAPAADAAAVPQAYSWGKSLPGAAAPALAEAPPPQAFTWGKDLPKQAAAAPAPAPAPAVAPAATPAAAPAATPAAAPAASEPAPVPQAYTWGAALPGAAPAAAETKTAEAAVPQAYTWGAKLPSAN